LVVTRRRKKKKEEKVVSFFSFFLLCLSIMGKGKGSGQGKGECGDSAQKQFNTPVYESLFSHLFLKSFFLVHLFHFM
jgi:hypothetical protein